MSTFTSVVLLVSSVNNCCVDPFFLWDVSNEITVELCSQPLHRILRLLANFLIPITHLVPMPTPQPLIGTESPATESPATESSGMIEIRVPSQNSYPTADIA